MRIQVVSEILRKFIEIIINLKALSSGKAVIAAEVSRTLCSLLKPYVEAGSDSRASDSPFDWALILDVAHGLIEVGFSLIID